MTETIDQLLEVVEATRIHIPRAHHCGIAVVGAGAIVEHAHLPAYASHGLPIRGILDLDHERASRVAAEFDVPRVYADLDELLADDEVEIVDVGVVPHAQPEIVEAALRADRHVLSQKPLALTVERAEELVALAEARGLVLVVNQQLRFDEGIAAAREVLTRGWLGDPTTVTFTVNIDTDFTDWDWLASSEQLEIMYHSIHYHDAIRSLLGTPRSVFCATSRTAGQTTVGETRSIATLVYDGDVRALVHAAHENRAGDVRAEFRIDGTDGSVRGTLGLLYDYPHGRPDTVEIMSQVLPTDGWVSYPVTRRWIPDAFAGPMGSLLEAVATGATPATAGRDNLDTLRLVHALYRSAATGESVRLDANDG